MLIERIKPTKYSKDDKARVECEICKKQRIVKWHFTCNKQNHYCRSCIPTLKLTGSKRTEEQKRTMSKAQRKQGWRIQEGYKQIIVDEPHPKHKLRKNGKYIFEHVLVMEKHLGRFLEEHELIHHIDENRLNNEISNLYLCSGKDLKESRQIHNFIHKSAENLTIKLLKLGLVKFENEKYVLSEELATLASRIL